MHIKPQAPSSNKKNGNKMKNEGGKKNNHNKRMVGNHS